MNRATRLIHHPGAVCQHTGAVSPPIHQVSTFVQDAVGTNRGYDYSRTGNPTRDVLERTIAVLEGAEETNGLAFASGMAAISACLTLLDTGDHVIATAGLYGGTYRLLTRLYERFGISTTFVDTGDTAAVEAAVTDRTRMIFVETPSNPTMRITDLAAVADLAHRRDALVVVDNTFMSPWLQRPLEAGADIVVHSATKFLGGHSDLIVGLAVCRDPALTKRLGRVQNAAGAVPGPMDCWLVIRGMKTLGVRMERGQATAARLAEWLGRREEVEAVLWPGAGDGPGADVHRRQAEGSGAVLSFRLRKGLCAEVLCNHTRVWTLAVSLGAVESIITLPARMTHLPYRTEVREALGIDDRLVRLSVGLEDPDDLIADLAEALAATK
jgi:cystathionine beta-lyase/cystathionine gamma-synthase